MKTRWSENETYQFVKIYLRYEFLWNSEHEYHKLKDKRLRAYKDIITAMNDTTGIFLNVTELKIKIKSLRSTYSQELSKIKNKEAYKPNMRWFYEWHKCYNAKKPAEDSFVSNQDTSETLCANIWIAENGKELEEEILEPFPEDDDEYEIIVKAEHQEVPQVPDRSLRASSSGRRSSTKKKNIKYRSSSTECSTVMGSTDSDKDCAAKEDEFDIYGKYIASQLRKMDLQNALKVQVAIQNLVSETRIAELNVND